jgi:hypothetical protein
MYSFNRFDKMLHCALRVNEQEKIISGVDFHEQFSVHAGVCALRMHGTSHGYNSNESSLKNYFGCGYDMFDCNK